MAKANEKQDSIDTLPTSSFSRTNSSSNISCQQPLSNKEELQGKGKLQPICSESPESSAKPSNKILGTNPEKLRKPEDRPNPDFFTQTMALANKLAALFEGDVLTDKVLSICKAQEAVKFRCQNGHVFYKYVDALKTNFKNATGRKISVSTAASSSTSSDEESQDAALHYGCWCPKCEEFYSSCKTIAKNSGLKLEGKLYSKILSFKCPERKHCTPISYNKRISQILSCADCKREQKEAMKERIRQEEEQQSKHISQMQEEMFRKAREEMERELRHGGYQPNSGAYSSYQQQSAFQQAQDPAYEA